VEAFVRRVSDSRFALLNGSPDYFNHHTAVIGEFSTRRQAIREGRKVGYEIIVKNRSSDPELRVSEKEIVMADTLNIRLSGREDYMLSRDAGEWLKLPASADDLNDVLEQIGVSGGVHGMDYFITDFSSKLPIVSNLPIENLRRMDIDQLNYIAGELEKLSPLEVRQFSSVIEAIGKNADFQRVAESRTDSSPFVHIPDVFNSTQLGEYYLNSNMINIPETWRGAVDVGVLGELAAERENGVFTEGGYVYTTDNHLRGFENIPEDYRIEQIARNMNNANAGMEALRMYDGLPSLGSNVLAVDLTDADEIIASNFVGFDDIPDGTLSLHELADLHDLELGDIIYDGEDRLVTDYSLKGSLENIARAVGDYSGTREIEDWLKSGVQLEVFGSNPDAEIDFVITGNNISEHQSVIDTMQKKVDSLSGMRRPKARANSNSVVADASKTTSNVSTREKPPSPPGDRRYPDAYERHKQTLKMLETGIKDVFESGKYQKYLDVVSKFHNYSYGNCVLIAKQMPHAKYVAGFNFWRDNMSRHVIKGEKAIKILAPSPYKSMREVDQTDKDGKTKTVKTLVTVPGYKAVNVFDVSQTYGEPMPKLANDLDKSVDKYNDLFDSLDRMSPVPIVIESIKSRDKGYFSPIEKMIGIKDGMSELQTIKTMIHEIAHARLHDIDNVIEDEANRPDSRTREVQAESIAYTVCQNYGLDTSDYSFGYIASWSTGKELPELKASLSVIRKEANSIIKEVDKQLETIQKEYAVELQEKETMIGDILAEIKRTEPDSAQGLSGIEKSMWAKSTQELRENDYSHYFPQKETTKETQAKAETQDKKTTEKKEPEKPEQKAAKKAPAKTAGKSAAKTKATSKPSIRSELSAAKKEAAKRSPPAKTKSISAEL